MNNQIISAYMPFLTDLVSDPSTIGSPIRPLPSFNQQRLLDLTTKVLDSFMNDPMLLKINGNFNVVGDLHGNLAELLRIFSYTGLPPHQNYLFLGDYVDRGEFSLEIVTLLFALKVAYPNNIFLLRGNHEFKEMNSVHGFKELICSMYSEDVFESFNKAFAYMPVAAILNNRVFCVHGGISQHLEKIDDIKSIERPIYDYRSNALLEDLVWSDPITENIDYCESKRGNGHMFGVYAVQKFLSDNRIACIVRAHQCVKYGVEKMMKNTVYTVFSTSSYLSDFSNDCGILNITPNGELSPNYFPSMVHIERKRCTFIDKSNTSPIKAFPAVVKPNLKLKKGKSVLARKNFLSYLIL